MPSIDESKVNVLRRIAGSSKIEKLPKAKFKVENAIIHIRVSRNAQTDGLTYAFNINPNTLSADFEVWICGSSEIYYLIPITEISAIYEDPTGYRDRLHPEIRIVNMKTDLHFCIYGRDGLRKLFDKYFRAVL